MIRTIMYYSYPIVVKASLKGDTRGSVCNKSTPRAQQQQQQLQTQIVLNRCAPGTLQRSYKRSI